MVTAKLLAGLTAFLLTSGAWAVLQAPVLQWGPVNPLGGASVYYYNDNVANGNATNGQLGSGLFEQDKSGARVNSLVYTPTSGENGAKSAVRVGDYVYFTSGNTMVSNQMFRTPATGAGAWSTVETLALDVVGASGRQPASITTDGTYIYATSATAGDGIQKYAINGTNLNLVWSNTSITGGIRGIDYDASGYLYAVNGGRTAAATAGNTATLYAILASSGAATSMGTITYNGELYQTVREGNQIAVFDACSAGGATPYGQMYVYDLSGDTSLVSAFPVSTWDPAGIDQIYGAAIDNNFMWLSGGSNSFGYAVPEPACGLLAAAGLLALLGRRNKR